jgi:hypothetical protein
MPGQSPTFFHPSVFIVSALCVFATPLSGVIAIDSGRLPDRTIYPSVSEVLRQNEALAVAAKAARKAGYDLTDMEFRFRDDNANWIEHTWAKPDLLSSALRAELNKDPYWAFLLLCKVPPNVLDGGCAAWVFVRRSDLTVLGLIRG